VSHENGSIEARQGSLKVALDQALLLRGTREFASLEVYGQFVAETVRLLNARCARAWEVDRVSLQALPARRCPSRPAASGRSQASTAMSPAACKGWASFRHRVFTYRKHIASGKVVEVLTKFAPRTSPFR
jgi:hypothetical protein